MISKLSRTLFVGLTLAFFASQSFAYSLPVSEKPLNDENTQALQKISRGVSAVAKHAEKAVVFVSVYKTVRGLPPGMIDPFEFFFGQQGQQGRGGQRQPPKEQRREEGLGSGFFIDLNQGYIMTNNHVVQDADEIQLKLANGDTHEGKIIGRDPNTDVAIVQVKDKNFNRTGLSHLVLSNSDESSIGDLVVAVGAPYGLEASVSFGIVSAMGRGSLQITNMGNFIQTDAAINPGNSGGPLLTTNGQVLGMNTAIYSRTGGYNGIGFAVPSNLARKIGEQLIAGGKVTRGYLGVGLQPIDPELHKSLNLPGNVHGPLVARVMEGGPGDKAGLEPGDVIVAVNKLPMRNETDVTSSIGLMTPGSSVELGIIRNGKPKTLAAKIGEFPNDDQVTQTREKGGAADGFGLSLRKLTPEMRERFNISSKSGLVIVAIQEGGEAERVGLQEGDLILQVNGKAATDVNQYKALAASGPRVVLRIERGGQYFFVSLKNK